MLAQDHAQQHHRFFNVRRVQLLTNPSSCAPTSSCVASDCLCSCVRWRWRSRRGVDQPPAGTLKRGPALDGDTSALLGSRPPRSCAVHVPRPCTKRGILTEPDGSNPTRIALKVSRFSLAAAVPRNRGPRFDSRRHPFSNVLPARAGLPSRTVDQRQLHPVSPIPFPRHCHDWCCTESR